MTKHWLPVALLTLIAGYGCGDGEAGSAGGSGGSAGQASGGAAGSVSAGGSSGSAAAGGSMASGGSTASGGSAAGGAGGSSGSATCFDVDSPYPEGPYGTDEGQVVANLELEGFVNLEVDAISATKPYVDYSLEALRRTGRCYAMVHVSEFF